MVLLEEEVENVDLRSHVVEHMSESQELVVTKLIIEPL